MACCKRKFCARHFYYILLQISLHDSLSRIAYSDIFSSENLSDGPGQTDCGDNFTGAVEHRCADAFDAVLMFHIINRVTAFMGQSIIPFLITSSTRASGLYASIALPMLVQYIGAITP